jgi:hypothetical protein
MDILGCAKSKIRGVLDTLDDVIAMDFPFRHSREALEEVKHTFKEIEKTLASLGPKSSPSTVNTNCRRALESISLQLPAIGFIARSTEISGPVEFHGPFLRIVQQAIGSNAKLIISSEWDFSPYTLIFPELFHQQIVLVGLPVSESDNALITPLAGHELGHNIWEHESFGRDLQSEVYGVVRGLIEGKYWTQFKNKFLIKDKSEIEGDMFARSGWENSSEWALAQAEEIFSDIIGLLIFREAYLHAFAYLIAPWGFERTERRYPTMTDRIESMVSASDRSGIRVPEGYSALFTPSETQDADDFLLLISDEAVKQILDKLFDLASQYTQAKSLIQTTEDVSAIVNYFEKCVPAIQAKSISSILNAGWQIRSAGKNPWAHEDAFSNDDEGWHGTLNELLLKSLEVFEIEQRQAN